MLSIIDVLYGLRLKINASEVTPSLLSGVSTGVTLGYCSTLKFTESKHFANKSCKKLFLVNKTFTKYTLVTNKYVKG